MKLIYLCCGILLISFGACKPKKKKKTISANPSPSTSSIDPCVSNPNAPGCAGSNASIQPFASQGLGTGLVGTWRGQLSAAIKDLLGVVPDQFENINTPNATITIDQQNGISGIPGISFLPFINNSLTATLNSSQNRMILTAGLVKMNFTFQWTNPSTKNGFTATFTGCEGTIQNLACSQAIQSMQMNLTRTGP